MFQAVSLAVIAVLTVIDRLTKYAAVHTVKVNGPKEFLFGLFRFRYVENTGAAFSAFSDSTTVLTVVTVIVLAVCLFILLGRKVKPMFVNVCLLLVVAGGIGNVIDRVLYGYVVDFIEPLFIDFAVFNFADCCVVIGTGLMILYVLLDERKAKKEKEQES